MFNEQMLENLNNIPSTKNLWENEKSKYRVWILLFGIGIFTIFGLLLSSFILDLVNRSDIQDRLIVTRDGIADTVQAATQFNVEFLIIPVIQISVLFFGLVYYLTSIYTSYQQKTFSRISIASTTVVSIGALFSLWGIINFFLPGANNMSAIADSPGRLFRFINYFITIFVWISTVGQVVRIRNTFLVSERAERLKNDPRYQAFLSGNFQQQGQNFGGFPFGFGPTSSNAKNTNAQKNTQNPSNQNPSQKESEVKAQVSKQSANEVKLSKMSLSQLKEVAKKLSISGYEKMNKKTLIETILRISE